MKGLKILFVVILAIITLSLDSCMMYARPARVTVRPAPVVVAAPLVTTFPGRRRPVMVVRPYRCHPRPHRFWY